MQVANPHALNFSSQAVKILVEHPPIASYLHAVVVFTFTIKLIDCKLFMHGVKSTGV